MGDTTAHELRTGLHELEGHQSWTTDLLWRYLADVQYTSRGELADAEANEDATENDEAHEPFVCCLHDRASDDAEGRTVEDTLAAKIIIDRSGDECANELANIDDGCCKREERCGQGSAAVCVSCGPVIIDEGAHAQDTSIVDLIVAIAEGSE